MSKGKGKKGIKRATHAPRMFEDGTLFNKEARDGARSERAKVADKGMIREMGKALAGRGKARDKALTSYSDDKYKGVNVVDRVHPDSELIVLDKSDPAAPVERDQSVPTITDFMRYKHREGGIK